MSQIVKLTDANFEEQVINASKDKPVLVDFWAPWCGPCQMQTPILEKLAKELGDKALITKLNVDENPQSSTKYQIQSIPNLKIFKNGKLVEDLIGLRMKEQLLDSLQKHF